MCCSLTILEAQKSIVSLDQNQGLAGLHSCWSLQRESKPCFYNLLVAASILWFVATNIQSSKFCLSQLHIPFFLLLLGYFKHIQTMAPHSSALAWKIPWMEEPGRLHGVAKSLTGLSFSLSCIGEGNGNLLQCSCLENPRDGGAWWADVYGVTQSWTRLSDLAAADLIQNYLAIFDHIYKV